MKPLLVFKVHRPIPFYFVKILKTKKKIFKLFVSCISLNFVFKHHVLLVASHFLYPLHQTLSFSGKDIQGTGSQLVKEI